MRKPVAALEISVGQRELLESVARSQSGAHREVVRAKPESTDKPMSIRVSK